MIDLHTHSTFSDGELIPAELIRRAKVAGYRAMILTALVGVTLERTAYRPLRRKGADRLYVVITALMAGLVLENGNLALLGASRKRFPDLIDKVIWNLGGVSVTNLKVVVIVAAIVVFLLLQFIVTRTKIGMHYIRGEEVLDLDPNTCGLGDD